MDIISWLLSKSYVDKTLVGMGALKGSSCTISSIVDNPDGTHDVTFSWKDNLDVTHTSVLTVKDGETPTITSTEITGGHRVTFTTTNPAQSVSFDVIDGATYDDTEIKQDIDDIWKVQGEFGVKNLLVYPYPRPSGGYAGVTFTAQSDGSFLVNGTATGYAHLNPYVAIGNESAWSFFNLPSGKYAISIKVDNIEKIANGSVAFLIRFTDTRVTPNVKKDYIVQSDNPSRQVVFEITQEDVEALNNGDIILEIRIFSVGNNAVIDNVIAYPMIRYASDTDDTWQPYTPTNYELDNRITNEVNNIYQLQNELGAKNLLKYPYYGTPRSYEGIEFTDSNGVITVNGSPSRAAYYNLRTQEPIYLKKGKYIASVSTPLGNDVYFQVIYNDGSGEKSLTSITRDTLSQEFTLTDDIISNATYWVVRIAVLANTQVDNLVIKPMIRLASDIDDTWQPYAPTNYQLNQKVDTIAGVYLPNATNINSKKAVASVGQTSVTFDANSFMTQYNVTASDLDLDISAETASGDVVAYNNVSVTGGIVTVTFDALAEQTTFICKCSVIQ